jgi:small-conductance mechanosensitive channel
MGLRWDPRGPCSFADLQSTLADVFAGIAVGIENPFRVGDRISLSGSVEGQVVEINWRSIRIQTDGADTVTIPNSVVAKQPIVNRSVPDASRAVSIELWCPATAESERVIDVLEQAILLCPRILETPAPVVAMSRLVPRAICYSVSFSVPDTQLVSSTKSQLLRHARRQLYSSVNCRPRIRTADCILPRWSVRYNRGRVLSKNRPALKLIGPP